MNYLNKSIKDLQSLGREKHNEYVNNSPFPNIVLDNFFDEGVLNKVLEEFPDLSTKKDVYKFDGYNEKKFAGVGESNFGEITTFLAHYLNSQPILEFLQQLTGITETLLPDPYFEGGGYHEIKPGGLLKIHADFNKHVASKLDRRINLLVYLNKDWEETYGGHFELWNTDMTKVEKKILPIFNRVAIFSTTSNSYHGHPDPLTCPPDRSRKSIAFYYYTNGRPQSEINNIDHNTLFVARSGVKNDTTDPRFNTFAARIKQFGKSITPPLLFNAIKSLLNR